MLGYRSVIPFIAGFGGAMLVSNHPFAGAMLVSGRVNRESKPQNKLACFHHHRALKLLHSEARREPHHYDLVRKAVSTWLWMCLESL